MGGWVEMVVAIVFRLLSFGFLDEYYVARVLAAC